MRKIIATIDTIERSTSSVDEIKETMSEFTFCIEGLHYTQTTQCLIYLG